jgi:hypothetical protein
MRINGWRGAPARSRILLAEASNRCLTNSSIHSMLANEPNRRLRNLIEGCESLCIGFVTLLRDDHV